MLSFVMAVAMSLSIVLAAPLATAAEAPPKGSLVIAGGAVRGDNTVIWQRVVQLAGGAGARIAVLPSASGNPARAGNVQAAARARRAEGGTTGADEKAIEASMTN